MSHALDALRALVERWVGPRLDHLALYPCTVIAQRASGGLDLQPDSPRVPPCADVPIRHGLPGVTVTVPSGGRVLLGYEGGNPDLPYAALWASGDVTAIRVGGGTAKASRVGHAVRVTIPIGQVFVAAPGPSPPSGTPVLNDQPITLDGTITEGADALRLP